MLCHLRTTPPSALALVGLLAASLLAPASCFRVAAVTAPDVTAAVAEAASPEASTVNAAAAASTANASSAFLRNLNGSVAQFPTCTRACQRCFDDHFQGCLAYCEVGCEDYCKEKLPQPGCLNQQKWVAQVNHIFATLDQSARMCQATGMNGCPDPIAPRIQPTKAPFDPYHAVERDETGPRNDELSAKDGDASAQGQGSLPLLAAGSGRAPPGSGRE
mmetsp:Transcript_60107/g.176382  ORF Transcript_60107/g.176382 Transcript_60107/m.176382 type:complete len:218 (-) Transcript_60107:74-727(-)